MRAAFDQVAREYEAFRLEYGERLAPDWASLRESVELHLRTDHPEVASQRIQAFRAILQRQREQAIERYREIDRGD